jgi:hypothetical protein
VDQRGDVVTAMDIGERKKLLRIAHAMALQIEAKRGAIAGMEKCDALSGLVRELRRELEAFEACAKYLAALREHANGQ